MALFSRREERWEALHFSAGDVVYGDEEEVLGVVVVVGNAESY